MTAVDATVVVAVAPISAAADGGGDGGDGGGDSGGDDDLLNQRDVY